MYVYVWSKEGEGGLERGGYLCEGREEWYAYRQ